MNTLFLRPQSVSAKMTGFVRIHLQTMVDRRIDHVLNTVQQFRKLKLYRDVGGITVTQMHTLEDQFLNFAKVSNNTEDFGGVWTLYRTIQQARREHRKMIHTMDEDIRMNAVLSDMFEGFGRSFEEQLDAHFPGLIKPKRKTEI